MGIDELAKIIPPDRLVELSLAFVVLFLVGKSGLIPVLLSSKEDKERRATDREERLIDNLQEDAERQRHWRIEADGRIRQLEAENQELRSAVISAISSSAAKEAELKKLTEVQQTMVAALVSEQAGNARLRHDLANLSVSDGYKTRLLVRAGIELPTFRFSDLTDGDPGLADLYRRVMAKGGELADDDGTVGKKD